MSRPGPPSDLELLASHMIDLAKRSIEWDASIVRPTRPPLLGLGAAVVIQREAKRLGVWPS